MWFAALLERIAAHFGFYRGLPTEIIVFRSHQQARAAGFQGEAHPTYRHIRAWWPGLGMRGLYCRPVQRVTISSSMLFATTPEGRLVDILLKRQMPWGKRAIWVEL